MGDDLRVLDWGEGLPSADDLTPLSQILITPELAAAFSLAPEPQRSLLDVHCASVETLEALCRGKAPPSPGEEGDEPREGEGEVGGVVVEDGEAAADDLSGREPKRPRLLWTPHLHKRFVDVVAHLGVKKAVPKTIMQLMNVEGLTRENVASHLQKYRLYLKRSSGDGESSSDQILSPKEDLVPHPAPPYPLNPTMIPVLGGGASIGMMPVNGQMKGGHYPWYASHHPYVVYGRPA